MNLEQKLKPYKIKQQEKNTPITLQLSICANIIGNNLLVRSIDVIKAEVHL